MSAKSILVVDDVPEILAFFERVASRYKTRPIEITTLESPQEAVDLLARRPFDVVISDFRMPRVNGVEVLRAAREANPEGRRILMTGYNEIPATAAEMDAAGPQAKIHKPLRASFLLEVLQACLSDDAHALDDIVQPEAET